MKKLIQKIKENKKLQLGLALGAVLIIVIVILAVYYFGGDSKITSNVNVKRSAPESLDYRRLDGIPIDSKSMNPPIVAVMIENLSTIRDIQAGLSSAAVVYEALAEGGITRFLALYPFTGDPDIAEKRIGPVRSARPYYFEWSSEYNALYVHIGGSPEALQAISGLEIPDLNAMYAGSSYFWRDTSIAAPHNLFTNGAKLGYAKRDKGLDDIEPTYRPWKFTDSASADESGSDDNDIEIDFSSPGYTVKWDYQKSDNRYVRYNGGEIQTDVNNDKELMADNVIVQYVDILSTGDSGRLELNVTGQGQALMFKDGKTEKGTWMKSSRTDRTIFYTEGGGEYLLNRGKIWIEIVPPDRTVTYNE